MSVDKSVGRLHKAFVPTSLSKSHIIPPYLMQGGKDYAWQPQKLVDKTWIITRSASFQEDD